jgi:hypothetical protein
MTIFTSNCYLRSFARQLQRVGFYGVERVGCVGESTSSEIFFQLLQKFVSLSIVRKFNRYALLDVGSRSLCRAKLAYA